MHRSGVFPVEKKGNMAKRREGRHEELHKDTLAALLSVGRYKKIAVLDLIPPQDASIITQVLDLAAGRSRVRIFRFTTNSGAGQKNPQPASTFSFDFRGGIGLWSTVCRFAPDLIVIPQPHMSDDFNRTKILPMLFPHLPIYFVDGAICCHRGRPTLKVLWQLISRLSASVLAVIFIHLVVLLGGCLWVSTQRGRARGWREFVLLYQRLKLQFMSVASLVYPEKFFGLNLLALGRFLAACARGRTLDEMDRYLQEDPATLTGEAILVVRIDHLGDVLNTVPFLAHLKERFPDKRVVLLVRDQTLDAIRGCPYVDEVWLYSTNSGEFNRGKKRWRDILQPLSFLSKLRSRRFAMALDPVGRIETQLLTYLSSAPYRAANSYYPVNLFGVKTGINHLFTEAHESERPFFLLEGLSKEPSPLHTGIWLSSEEELRAQAYAERFSKVPSVEMVAVHPTANWQLRCWPARRFAQMLVLLLERAPGAHVLLLGTPRELEVLQRVGAEVRKNGGDGTRVHLVHDLDLRTLMGLVARCRLFIGNDSGIFHIAVALGVPAVAIFGPGDRKRWGAYPISRAPLAAVGGDGLPCIPCPQEACIYDSECLRRITVEQVWEVVRDFVAVSLLQGRKLDSKTTTAVPES